MLMLEMRGLDVDLRKEEEHMGQGMTWIQTSQVVSNLFISMSNLVLS